MYVIKDKESLNAGDGKVADEENIDAIADLGSLVPKQNSVGGIERKLHQKKTKAEMQEMLKTDFEQGLTSKVARRRLEIEGQNALTEKEQTPWYCVFIGELTGLF
jgi:magnesium-transporting ATPase (P-type)